MTMIERYYIGAYWGIRKESSEVCAQRLVNLLECLAHCDPCFTRWFKKGQSRKDALQHEVEIDERYIQALLLDGKNLTDFGNEIIENLGFRIGLWTGGNDEETASLHMTCGCYSSTVAINSCVINLPYGGQAAERLLHKDIMMDIMNCIVTALEPEWGIVNSNAYVSSSSGQPANVPRIGWIVYLSSPCDNIPQMPASVQILSQGAKGSFIITTSDLFTVSNVEHVKIANQVTSILEQSGVFGVFK